MVKECSRCKKVKSDCSFRLRKRKSSKGIIEYLNSECKECEKLANNQYREQHREEILSKNRTNYQSNKEEINRQRKEKRDQFRRDNPLPPRTKQSKEEKMAKNKEWQLNNPDKRKASVNKYHDTHKEQEQAYYKNNKEYIIERNRKYRKANKDKINARVRERRKNPVVKLRHRISVLIRHYIRGIKDGSCMKFLPFTMDQLKQNLEILFSHPDNLTPDGKVWMTWDNWGIYNAKTWNDNNPFTWTWNINHIIPQSSLPYDSMEHPNFKKCWALENLRPYSAKQNIINGCRLQRNRGNI